MLQWIYEAGAASCALKARDGAACCFWPCCRFNPNSPSPCAAATPPPLSRPAPRFSSPTAPESAIGANAASAVSASGATGMCAFHHCVLRRTTSSSMRTASGNLLQNHTERKGKRQEMKGRPRRRSLAAKPKARTCRATRFAVTHADVALAQESCLL